MLVIGAGGLGAPVLIYLAAAGVGTLGIVDDDEVSLSNLQRQIVHDTASVGVAKTASAAASLARINPACERGRAPGAASPPRMRWISSRPMTSWPTAATISRPAISISDACFLARRDPGVGGGGQFDGQISTFKPHSRGPDGRPYPTYRCLNPEAPPPGLLPACEEAGMIGALTGVMGSIQAIEVIKEMLGIGDSLAGRLLIYDALAARFYAVKISWDPQNPLNGPQPDDPRSERPQGSSRKYFPGGGPAVLTPRRSRHRGLQVLRPRRGDDVVAGIDVVDFAGDAARQGRQQIDRRAADLLERDGAAQRRMALLEIEHGAGIADAGAGKRAHGAGRNGVHPDALRADNRRRDSAPRIRAPPWPRP